MIKFCSLKYKVYTTFVLISQPSTAMVDFRPFLRLWFLAVNARRGYLWFAQTLVKEARKGF